MVCMGACGNVINSRTISICRLVPVLSNKLLTYWRMAPVEARRRQAIPSMPEFAAPWTLSVPRAIECRRLRLVVI
jgi:hypothetical protein